MKVLYVNTEDSRLNKQMEEAKLTQEMLELVDEGLADLFRFHEGNFEQAVIGSEEVLDDEDDEESDTHLEYSIDSWKPVK